MHLNCYGHALLDNVFALYLHLSAHGLLDCPFALVLADRNPVTDEARLAVEQAQAYNILHHFVLLILLRIYCIST